MLRSRLATNSSALDLSMVYSILSTLMNRKSIFDAQPSSRIMCLCLRCHQLKMAPGIFPGTLQQMHLRLSTCL